MRIVRTATFPMAFFISSIVCHPSQAEDKEVSKTSKAPTEVNQKRTQTNNPQVLISVPSKWEAGFKESMHEAAIEAAHEKKGDEYMKAKEFDAAISEYNTALKISGRRGLLENLAEAYEAKGEYRTAITYLQELLDHWPSPVTRPDAEHWKNALEAADQGHFDQAVQIYETLLAKAEDWERPQLQQRLDAMKERAHVPSSKNTH